MLEKWKFIVAMVALVVTIVAGYIFAWETPTTPCSPNGFPARCYRISQHLCETVWQKSEESCKEMLQKLSLPPGRLIGPFLLKCQSASLDEIFAYSRKSSPECDQWSTEVKDWRRRNAL